MTESKPSKSARKRNQLELQQLGEQLLALSDGELASMPLDERLLHAVRQARSMKAHGALRRQRQYIGKLMREVDPQPIRAGLARLRADDLRQKRVFAEAERWRERIVRERGTGLDAFESETGSAVEELRSLLANLDSAFGDRDKKAASRKIFRRVHEILAKIRP